MSYRDIQLKRGEELIQQNFFDDATGGCVYRDKPRPYVLQDGSHNLYPKNREDALTYFQQNNITWWSGKAPTGHILSSQIACLNHLFTIKNDKYAVLNLLKTISDGFTDVLPIDEHLGGYIQFEAVGGNVNLLNEGTNKRGSNCTSVDALICALHQDGRYYMIPIEWKYVESYGNEDKSEGDKGITRKSRYNDLIANSQYLINDNKLSCYWVEPFYQLMRQTLWVEQQLLNHRPEGFGLEDVDYIHVHVIPDGNKTLLKKKYPCSNKEMKETWKSCLTFPDKYVVISPQQFYSKQPKDTELYRYLSTRYWDAEKD